MKIYTIGHSSHSIESFLNLLISQGIEVLVDVRSSTFSRFAPQYNSKSLRAFLIEKGIKYLYLGNELGGRPTDRQYYDLDGHVLYNLLAESPLFFKGISRLVEGLDKCTIALLCAEEDPSGCHRRLLVGRILRERGISVLHIRGDGSVQTEEELFEEEKSRKKDDSQLPLFVGEETKEWKSTQSVLLRKGPKNSSNH